MRRFRLIPALAVALVVGTAAPATADDLVGLLIDHACFTARLAEGKWDLNGCGISGVQKGHRLALLTQTGEIYLVSGPVTQDNNAKLVPLLNRVVVLSGAVRVENLVEAVAPKEAWETDTRRNARRDNEVIERTTERRGDFREGDYQKRDTREAAPLGPLAWLLAPDAVRFIEAVDAVEFRPKG